MGEWGAIETNNVDDMMHTPHPPFAVSLPLHRVPLHPFASFPPYARLPQTPQRPGPCRKGPKLSLRVSTTMRLPHDSLH